MSQASQYCARVLLLMLGMLLPVANAAAPPVFGHRRAFKTVDESLEFEAHSAIRRGTAWLAAQQQVDGSWGEHRALTSFATLALLNDPTTSNTATGASRAVEWLTQQTRLTGVEAQYPTLTLALGTLAVARLQRPEDHDFLLRRRHDLLATLDPATGGFRSAPGHPADLFTTTAVLEALAVTRDRADSAVEGDTTFRFLRRCQQADGTFLPFIADSATKPLPAQPFVLGPGIAVANGLKALLFTDPSRHPDAAQRALGWLARQFTSRENPGVGEAGVYGWLFHATQALQLTARSGFPPELAGGQLVNWRSKIILALLERQGGDGSWRQSSPGGWESRPELATAYALLALELALRE